MEDWDFDEEAEEYEQPAPDSYFKESQEDLRKLFEENKESVFYLRQLQVRFEKQYFHWVTNNALIGLFKIGFVKDYRIEKEKGTSTRYFMHKSNRYPVRAIQKIEEVVEEYSKDEVTRGCGYRAENLFCQAFALHGFMPLNTKVKEFKGRKWTKTDNDLDFIFQKDGIEYGCEIKNTLGYIDREELDIKLEMCAFFGIKPLFIMRYAPKTYNKLIFDNGGFALIFKTQIYELGQIDLVKKILETTGLPVISSKAIPDGIVKRFDDWHKVTLEREKKR